MSFAPSRTSRLRHVPAEGSSSGRSGREALVRHVDRWFRDPEAPGAEHAALVVVDVDLDGAVEGAHTGARPDPRPCRTVALALAAGLGPGDVAERIDVGRFGLLRVCDAGATVAADLARRLEEALVGRPEGLGVRVVIGTTDLRAGSPRDGRSALCAVTAAMLEAKVLRDDRMAVVVAGLDQTAGRGPSGPGRSAGDGRSGDGGIPVRR